MLAAFYLTLPYEELYYIVLSLQLRIVLFSHNMVYIPVLVLLLLLLLLLLLNKLSFIQNTNYERYMR